VTPGQAGSVLALGIFTMGGLTVTLGTPAGQYGIAGAGSAGPVPLNTLQPLWPQLYATWGAANSTSANTISVSMIYALAWN
jgi:hypothetical protein